MRRLPFFYNLVEEALMITRKLRLACVALAALAATAALAGPSAIFTSSGLGSNDNIGGVPFNTFDRPVKSPDGSRWMLLTRALQGGGITSANDAMYITGQGAAGTLVVREGTTPVDGARVGGDISDRDVSINNSGQWAALVNLDGATTDDEVIVRGAAGAGPQSIAVREGQAVPALPGLTYGSSNFSPNLNNAGQLSFGYAVAGSGVTTSNDGSFFRANGNTLSTREGTASVRPTGQAGGTTLNWGTISSTLYFVADNGNDWMLTGTLASAPAASDTILTVNNDVKIQEGSALAGVTGTVSFITGSRMEGNGDWFARGKNNNEIGWAVKNGAVLSKTGDLVPGGEPGEHFSDDVWTNSSFGTTFFIIAGNNNGDTVVGGFTDNTDGTRNAVWVYNQTSVFLRNGDQVDVNGDTVLDDAFIYFSSLTGASVVPLGGFLADDGWFYFTSELRNGAGDDLGEAFLRVEVPEPTALALLACGAAAMLRRRR
jgi:hypothetical protein